MSFMTTGLQFGYFLGLLFAILFWIRAYREERLSDTLLGWIMFFLAMEIQDYTFGFAGINMLWEELDGFPRHFPWIFPATVYFYLHAQTNRKFTFNKRDVWHIVPYLLYFIINLILFSIGKEARNNFINSPIGRVAHYIEYFVFWFPIFYYLIKSLLFYKKYLQWIETQYSNVIAVNFSWMRNFIYAFIIGYSLKLVFQVTDLLRDLPYEQDYFWQLFIVIIIAYVSISGYASPQYSKLAYAENIETESSETTSVKEVSSNIDYEIWREKIEKLIQVDQIHLEPELSLQDVAQKLHAPTSTISAAINTLFEKNFNDYINEYRVSTFKEKIKDPNLKHLTLLSIAFECGFNSKATFNRAVKKSTGLSPRDLT
jgi:AraC-like DNA-binding protein